MNTLKQESSDWLDKYRNEFVLTVIFFAIYLCIYVPMCVRHGVAVEETQFSHNHLPVMLCNGRWGVFLFRYLTHSGEYLPYAAGILAGMFISAAVLVQTKIFNIRFFSHRIVYAVFYFSCTQWAHQLRYSNQSHAIALGILSASVAVYIQFTNKQTIKTFIASTLLLCYSISTYQTLALYYGTLVAVAFVARSINGTLALKWRKVLFICGAVLLALFFYYIIGKLLLSLFPPPTDMLQRVKEYQQGMTGYSFFLAAPFMDKCQMIEYYAIRVPLANLLGKIYRGQGIITLAFIPAIILMYMQLKRRSYVNIVLLMLIMVLPYLGAILLFKDVPVRTFIAEPVSFAGVWSVALRDINLRVRLLKILICSLLGFIFVYSSCRVATISRDEHWAWERSKEEVLSMYHHAKQVARSSGMPDCNICILGKPSIPTAHLFDIEDVGFRLNEVYPNIIKGKAWTDYYLYYLRLSNIKKGDDSDLERHREVFEVMPNWPSEGSVRMSKGEVIIRVGSTK